MKSMKKALAFVLALVMIVTLVPVTNANAATLSKTASVSKTYIAGKDYTLKVKTPDSWKNVSVSWDGEGIGTYYTIDATNAKGTKATISCAKGTSNSLKTITAEVTYKKNGTGKKKTAEFTMTANIKTPGIKFTDEGLTMTVGETVTDADLAQSGAVSKSCPSQKKTDKLTKNINNGIVSFNYTSADESIVAVQDGSLVAVAAGTTTVDVQMVCGSKVKKNTSTLNVTVEAEGITFTAVAQKTVNTIELTFDGDASEITKDDITIIHETSNENYYVQTVAVDGNTVTATTFKDMNDAAVYTVTVGDVSLDFTATDGVVTGVSITPAEVIVDVDTPVYAQLTDANGVIIYEVGYTGGSMTVEVSSTEYVDFDVEVASDSFGSITSTGVILYNVGDKATVAVTYRRYNGDGDLNYETTGEGTITAVDSTTAISYYDARYMSAVSAPWNASTTNYGSGTWTTYIPAEEDIYAYLAAIYNDGTESYDFSAYTFESSDTDIFTISDDAETENGKLILTGYQAGSAYIVMRDGDGNVVYTFPITFTDARYAKSLSLSKSSLTVTYRTNNGDAESIEGVTTGSVDATVYDQYGEDMLMWDYVNNGYYGNFFDVTTKDSEGNETAGSSTWNDSSWSAGFDDGSGIAADNFQLGIMVDAAELSDEPEDKAVYTTTVSYTDKNGNTVSATFKTTVRVPDEDGTSTYKLDLASTADSTIATWATGDTTLTATMYEYKDGIIYDICSGAKFTSLVKGTTIIYSNDEGNGMDTSVGGIDKGTSIIKDNSDGTATITLTDIGNGVSVEAGKYTITATITDESGNTTEYKKSFTVTNSQPTATLAKILALEGTDNNLGSYFTVNYDGYTLTNDKSSGSNIYFEVESYDYTSYESDGDKTGTTTVSTSTNGNLETGSTFVKTAHIKISWGSDECVLRDVAINKTITVNEE